MTFSAFMKFKVLVIRTVALIKKLLTENSKLHSERTRNIEMPQSTSPGIAVPEGVSFE